MKSSRSRSEMIFRCEADSYQHDVCMHYCLRACAKNAAIALPTALSVLCAICRIPARMLQCRLGLRSAWLRGCRSVMNGWNPSPSQIRVTIMMILLALSSLNSSRYRFVLWSRRRHSFCRCRFCMNVCVCTHAHARTHARTHTHTHTHAHTCTHTHARAHTCLSVCLSACLSVCLSVCLCMYICMYSLSRHL